VPSYKELQVSLTNEEYARLQTLAAKRDCSVEDLVRQAIRQVYMNDREQDLTRQDLQRLEETPLLMDEEEKGIGIRGATIHLDKEGHIP
jgi:predicted transcriptional regulator